MKKLLFLLGLLVAPAVAFSGQITPPCFEVSPHDAPEISAAVCTVLLDDQTQPEWVHAEAFLNRGIAWRELQNYDASISDLQQALAIDPENTSTLRMLAWSYREQGNYTKAEDIYTQVLASDPHWQGWLSRCAVRYGLKKYSEAISDCDEAEKQTKNADITYFKAASLIDSGRPFEALQVLEGKLTAYDVSGRLYHVSAIAMWNSGDQQGARNRAREGLRFYPDDPDLIAFLQD